MKKRKLKKDRKLISVVCRLNQKDFFLLQAKAIKYCEGNISMLIRKALAEYKKAST